MPFFVLRIIYSHWIASIENKIEASFLCSAKRFVKVTYLIKNKSLIILMSKFSMTYQIPPNEQLVIPLWWKYKIKLEEGRIGKGNKQIKGAQQQPTLVWTEEVIPSGWYLTKRHIPI